MATNLLKLMVLIAGLVGYVTLSQELASEGKGDYNQRSKRNIYLNSKTPILIAAYITIPISVAFPALQGRSARSKGEYFNATQVPYSYDDPLFQSQLRRVDLYMDYIGIPDDMCRQRFLCEISASPTTYDPIYSIFKKQLSTDFPVKKTYSNRFFRYTNAMEEGKKMHQLTEVQRLGDEHTKPAVEQSVCHQLYGSCPNGIKETLNMDVLRVMQYLTRKFQIQFADTASI